VALAFTSTVRNPHYLCSGSSYQETFVLVSDADCTSITNQRMPYGLFSTALYALDQQSSGGLVLWKLYSILTYTTGTTGVRGDEMDCEVLKTYILAGLYRGENFPLYALGGCKLFIKFLGHVKLFHTMALVSHHSSKCSRLHSQYICLYMRHQHLEQIWIGTKSTDKLSSISSSSVNKHTKR
jgi:hypothetical protein